MTFANPVYDGYFADPFLFRHDDCFYAVGTGPVVEGAAGFEFPILTSPDLRRWTSLGGALIRPKVDGHCFWAPEVAHHAGIFYLYYSVGVSDQCHELRVATSDRPEGPYLDTGKPILPRSSTPFAIDPNPFRDVDGKWYLFYARDFLDSGGLDRAGTALVVAPLIEMVTLSEEFTTVARAHHDWQRYQSKRPIYGGIYDWHTLEGPCAIRHDDRYYCLYSGGNWQDDTYGVDFVTADSVMGPWTDSNPDLGPRVLRSVPGHVLGPGHNSVVCSPAGALTIAYHAWDNQKTARRLCLDELIWTDDGPRCLEMIEDYGIA